MKVAVTCGCYGRRAFTEFCLPLAMQNAGMEADWFFIDDGCPDNSIEFLRRLRSDRVRIGRHMTNEGMFPTRNEGLKWGLNHGADLIVSMDNDLLLPPNWLRDMVRAMGESTYGIGGPWFVNDVTINKTIERVIGPIDKLETDDWIDIGICGGTCAVHRAEVLKAGLFYNAAKESWTYGDSEYIGRVKYAGFNVGIYTGVQAWRLEHIIWPDPEFETRKLLIRHKYRHGGKTDGFEESLKRDWDRHIWIAR